jgi:peptide/nickel transport system permease protein
MIEVAERGLRPDRRAKGISERRVVYKHGMRAALTPIATIFGLDVAFALTGAIFTNRSSVCPASGLVTCARSTSTTCPS